MEERSKFDNDIRSRFEGFSPEPPAEVWLSVKGAIVMQPRKSLVPVFYRVAAAIAFLAIGGLSVFFLTNDNQTAMPLADLDNNTGTIETTTPVPTDEGVVETEHPTPSARWQTPATASSDYTLAASHVAEHDPASDAYPMPPARAEAVYPLSRASHMMAAAIPHQNPKLQQGRKAVPGITRGSAFDMDHSLNQYAFASTSAAPATGITLGIHLSPTFHDRHIAEYGSLVTTASSIGAHERPVMSYGFGISAMIQVHPRLALQTGAGYSSMTQMINDINAYAHFDNRPFYNAGQDLGYSHPQNIVTSYGMIEMKTPALYFTDEFSDRVLISNDSKYELDLPEDPKLLDLRSQQLTQAFSFVEIPLIARYRLFENRFLGLYLKAGVAGNILVRNDVILSQAHLDQPDVIGQTAGVRSFNYSGIGGFALTVPVTNRLRFFVEPTAQMFLQPILTDEMQGVAGKTYPYCFNVASGISFRF